MSQGVKQPIGQKRLTNVALVKYKKHGKRFEIACYKNKVVNWRNGVEKDLDEVLQTTAVFSNVSKGVLANKEDLKLVFGTDDEEKVCLRILAEGDFQVSDKERELEYQTLFRDVASILAEKCVNSQSNRPFTISMLERSMKDLHISVDPKRSAKQQALEVLPKLRSKIPIQRALMRLKLLVPAHHCREAKGMLQDKHAQVESEDLSGQGDSQVCFVFLVEPGFFRSIHDTVHQIAGGQERLEVLALAATSDEGPSDFDNPAHSSLNAVSATATGPHLISNGHQAPVASSAGRQDEQGSSAAGNVASSSKSIVGQVRQPGARPQQQASSDAGRSSNSEVVMERGPMSSLPEDLGARRERFLELDELQPGWQVELIGRQGGGPVDAVFYSPSGERIGAFTNARRAALQASKQAQN